MGLGFTLLGIFGLKGDALGRTRGQLPEHETGEPFLQLNPGLLILKFGYCPPAVTVG